MPTRRDIIEAVIQEEGGFVLTNWSSDLGRRTFAGISERYHPRWSGWQIIDDLDLKHGDRVHRSTSDPRTSALVTAVFTFYDDYYRRFRADEIISTGKALAYFDFCVNSGQGVRIAQIASGAKPDNVVGPKTLAAINAMPLHLFAFNHLQARQLHYARLVKKKPSQAANIEGWTVRAFRVYLKAVNT